MPIYDAKCKKCENIFEYTSSIADRDNVQKCPECEGNAYKTIQKPNNFVLKGTGWYVTDEIKDNLYKYSKKQGFIKDR